MIGMPETDLAPGDRAPNFVLPGGDGKYYMLYERVHGGDLMVLLAGDAAALVPFRAATAAFAAAGVEPYAILPGDPPLMKPDAAEPDAGSLFVVYDVKRAIGAAYARAAGRPAPAPGEVLCVLCDANQRVLAIEAGAAEVVAAAALARYRDRPRRPGVVLGATAPVLLVPDVLDAQQRAGLIALWDSGGHQEGVIYSETDGNEGNRLYQDKKSRLDHTIQDQALQRRLHRLIGRRIAPELEKAFLFSDPLLFDRIIIGCYDSARGDKFVAHRDNLGEMKRRKFALTINLNAEDYEGGEVRFPEYGPDWFKAPSGCAVLFSCSLLHEVRPLTVGRRFALLTFLMAPAPMASAARPAVPAVDRAAAGSRPPPVPAGPVVNPFALPGPPAQPGAAIPPAGGKRRPGNRRKG